MQIVLQIRAITGDQDSLGDLGVCGGESRDSDVNVFKDRRATYISLLSFTKKKKKSNEKIYTVNTLLFGILTAIHYPFAKMCMKATCDTCSMCPLALFQMLQF